MAVVHADDADRVFVCMKRHHAFCVAHGYFKHPRTNAVSHATCYVPHIIAIHSCLLASFCRCYVDVLFAAASLCISVDETLTLCLDRITTVPGILQLARVPFVSELACLYGGGCSWCMKDSACRLQLRAHLAVGSRSCCCRMSNCHLQGWLLDVEVADE